MFKGKYEPALIISISLSVLVILLLGDWFEAFINSRTPFGLLFRPCMFKDEKSLKGLSFSA